MNERVRKIEVEKLKALRRGDTARAIELEVMTVRVMREQGFNAEPSGVKA